MGIIPEEIHLELNKQSASVNSLNKNQRHAGNAAVDDLKGACKDKGTPGNREGSRIIPSQLIGGVGGTQKAQTSGLSTAQKKSAGHAGSSASRPGQFYHQYKSNNVLAHAQAEMLYNLNAPQSLDDRVEEVTKIVQRNII